MLNIFSLKIVNYKLRILSGQITNCADAEHLSVHSSLPWRPCRLATSSSPVTYSLSPRLTILLNNITTSTIIIPSTIMVSCHLHTLNLTTTINSFIVTYSHSLHLTILLNNITTILLNTTISIFSSLSWSLVSTSAETLCQQSCILIVLFGRVKDIAINLLYSLLFMLQIVFPFLTQHFRTLVPVET